MLEKEDIAYLIYRLRSIKNLIDAGNTHMAVAKLLADIVVFETLLAEEE